MKISYVVEPNDVVRLGQRNGINVHPKDAAAELKKNQGAIIRACEDATRSVLDAIMRKIGTK